MSVQDALAEPIAEPSQAIGFRRRRVTLVIMTVLALLLGLGGWALTYLDRYHQMPGTWPVVIGGSVLAVTAILVLVCWRLPYADPLILACVIALNGIGLAMINRIDIGWATPAHTANAQLIWTGLGIALFALTVFFLKDHRRLQRFPYLLFLVGLGLLLLPLMPGIGRDRFGSRIWISLAGYSFQPAEIAKIVLAVAFAAYLVDHREVLALAGPKVLGLHLPRLRDLGPIAIMWLASLAVLVFENDLGTSLLFFGLFVMMLYVATERAAYPVLGAVMFVVGAYFGYQSARHVRVRVNAWLHPFDNFDQNFQVIQAQFGFAYGGLTGRGWGLGRPGLTPLASSDFIAGAIGEELGAIGLMAVVMIYALIVARGLRMALSSQDAFSKLLAAGISFVFALQVFAIIGGVTRLLPLTGLTTPFMSQGGSSLIANWVIAALLLIISHRARRPWTPLPAEERVISADLADDDTRVIS